jgi:hypothetical protein
LRDHFALPAQNQCSIRAHFVGAINRNFRSVHGPADGSVGSNPGQRAVALRGSAIGKVAKEMERWSVTSTK